MCNSYVYTYEHLIRHMGGLVKADADTYVSRLFPWACYRFLGAFSFRLVHFLGDTWGSLGIFGVPCSCPRVAQSQGLRNVSVA